MSGCEGLDSCLTLSTLLMDPKLDFQKLRDRLSKYFIVGSRLITKFMSQKHLKIDSDRSGLADDSRPGQD